MKHYKYTLKEPLSTLVHKAQKTAKKEVFDELEKLLYEEVLCHCTWYNDFKKKHLGEKD